MRIRQSFDAPTVYLDHWAMRLFSDDYQLQERLTSALKARGGTLLFSNINIAEFAKAEDPTHLTNEKFLQRVSPNLYISNFDPEHLLKREMHATSQEKRF